MKYHQTSEEALEYINAQENWQSLALVILKLSKEYKKNKKLKECQNQLTELWWYLESLKTKNRLLNNYLSEIKYELNKLKHEHYDFKRETQGNPS
ncbi:MAG: hypothetical protein Unbinned5607contig1000_54 [Prokaryotic dsDNA virus sp.]|nr:MAG: hypothetical protein Unbinned5607contig1000_54 [Prokaryotic dsDNA virus sp.]|tara:strand:+ start:23550 stop:23834 length:285 start_codon:yes stop_codon:yes gene_type:complete